MSFIIKKPFKCFNSRILNIYFSTRVRFAPSPTGVMHVGGIKTALVNFLFAKTTNGKLILRIEDTDRSRCDIKFTEHLLKSLDWMNIKFDEGITDKKPHPDYLQSNRLKLYKDAVDFLIYEKKAYRCFCSNQRLDLLRKEQMRRGETPGYDRRCCNLTDSDLNRKMLQQSDYTVRLKLNSSPVVNFNDIVFGEVTVPLTTVESDPIIFKSDGYPVYHLANVVDDHHMGITHVIRGQEWLVSTPKHIVIYDSFGWKPPKFAHLPLIVKTNGRKVSKRDNDFADSYYNIDYLIRKGFTPESVMVWLMSSGGGLDCDWSPSLTLPKLMEKFQLSRITTHNARLNDHNLLLSGRTHLSSLTVSPEYFAETISPCLVYNSINLDFDRFIHLFQLLKTRLNCFSDIANFSYIWHHSPLNIGQMIRQLEINNSQLSKIAISSELLKRFVSILQTVEDPESHLENLSGTLCSKSVAMKLIRISIINQKDGPKVSELISMFSKDEIIRRLNLVISNLENPSL